MWAAAEPTLFLPKLLLRRAFLLRLRYRLQCAYYLKQVNYATNAAAWMIGGEGMVAWFQVRDNTCSVVPDPLGCRIRMTRERTHMILNQNAGPRINR
jgi:hypothetical protein